MKSYDADNAVNQVSILAQHRNNLLSRVHKEQNKLDCLDYLLFQLRKKKNATILSSYTPHTHD